MKLETDDLMRGRLTPDAIQAAGPNALTRAIGRGESVITDVCVERLRPDDGVLLTTDGLTAVVDDDTIAATVQACRHPRAIVDGLIRSALAHGAKDNITCVYGHWRSILA